MKYMCYTPGNSQVVFSNPQKTYFDLLQNSVALEKKFSSLDIHTSNLVLFDIIISNFLTNRSIKKWKKSKRSKKKNLLHEPL